MIPCLFQPRLSVSTVPVNGVRVRMVLRCIAHGDEGVLEVHVFGGAPYWFTMNGEHHGHKISEAGLFIGDAESRIDAAAHTMVKMVSDSQIWTEDFKARLENAAYGEKKRKLKEFTERMIKAINK